MLKAGGTKHHSELLKPFGLDASDPKFWQIGLGVISGLIDELEALDLRGDPARSWPVRRGSTAHCLHDRHRPFHPLPRRFLRRRGAVRPAAQDHRRRARSRSSSRRWRPRRSAHDAGKWLAGYFSYEAGYLLEPKLAPIIPEGQAHAADGARRLRRTVRRPPCPQDRRPQTNGPIFGVSATWSFEDYKKRFDRVHRHLREGDCYQANLTFPVEAKWTGDPLVGLRRAGRAAGGEIRRAGRSRRAGHPVALAGTVLRDRRRGLDRDASDEGHGAARQDARGGRGAEALPRQRPEEPGREPHDRRPAAQRHLADLARSARSTCRSSSASRASPPCTRW